MRWTRLMKAHMAPLLKGQPFLMTR